jgi:hypothetical protein
MRARLRTISLAAWPLASLLGVACASSTGPAPADPALVPAASAAAPLAATDFPTQAPSAIAESGPTPEIEPSRPPAPEPPARRRNFDCDPGGKQPVLCVPPEETEGRPAEALTRGGAGKCRDHPRQAVCRACRAIFEERKDGKCCYRGASRFELCEDAAPFEP